MDFDTLIRDRYSCKNFSDKKLEREKLTKILEAGRLAPTAKNLQEQHIYVVESEENLKKIDEETRCRYGAPTVLIVTYDKDNVFTYPGESRESGAEDATIVATHMLLAAENEGVNSCWINLFDPQSLKEKFNLPENEEVLMLLDLGYKNEGVGALENHFKRKALEETVTYI